MLSFSSCNNEIDDIFDQNAAERTESAMKDYEAFLLADGGTGSNCLLTPIVMG